MWLALKVAGIFGWNIDPPDRLFDMTQAQAAWGLVLSFVGKSTVPGWLATRYDWGRKSRY